MIISANYHKKQPVEGVEYASEGYHLTIEIEPPAEVQDDRDKLRSYVERLFSECRARVEAELAQTTSTTDEKPAPRNRAQTRHRPMRGPSGRSNANSRSNGDGRQNGSLCSPKQANYIRSLGTQAGFTYDDLGYMAEEAFGKRDLRSLTKKEASAMIDDLRNGEDG